MPAKRREPDSDEESSHSPTQAEMLQYYAEDDASPPRAAIVPRTYRSPAASSQTVSRPLTAPQTPGQPRLNPGLKPASPSAGASREAPFATQVRRADVSRPNHHDPNPVPPHASMGRSPSRELIRRDDINAMCDELNEQARLNDDLLADMESMKRELTESRQECEELRQRLEDKANAEPATTKFTAELERIIEDERREHAASVEKLAKQSAEALEKEQASRRQLEAEQHQKDIQIAKLQTQLDIANAKIESLVAALNEERLASAGLASHYRGVLTNMVQVAPSSLAPHIVPVRTASLPDLSTPPRGPRYNATETDVGRLMKEERTERSTPPNVRRASPARASPPRPTTTPPVPTNGLNADRAGTPTPSVVTTRPVIRDKNEASKGSTDIDAREVEGLEQELFELSSERDSIDEQLRKIEHVRVRCIADKAKKETLTRRLAELNAAVGVVRKRLRDLSALER